jgi:hypothetical protein
MGYLDIVKAAMPDVIKICKSNPLRARVRCGQSASTFPGCERSEKSEKSPPPAWGPGEAAQLLADLRAVSARAAREDFGGRPPGAFVRVAGDLVELAEGYVTNHEAEATRGWDALQLLRGLRPVLTQAVANAKAGAAVAKEEGC